MLELSIVVGVEWSDGAGDGADAESGAYDDASWASVESGNLMLLLLLQ